METQHLKCYYCSKELDLGRKDDMQAHHNSPSIDRVVAGSPYSDGSVVIACSRCNTVKSFGTPDEHEAIALGMRRFMQKTHKT